MHGPLHPVAGWHGACGVDPTQRISWHIPQQRHDWDRNRREMFTRIGVVLPLKEEHRSILISVRQNQGGKAG